MALYTPSLFHRLLDRRPHDSRHPVSFGWPLEQLKDAVARDTDLDNRVDIVIEATLKADAAAEPVLFDAVLKPSAQQYLIRDSRLSRDEAS